MKKLSLAIVMALSLASGTAKALTVRLYGSSGVVIKDGKTKICPGLSFNCCATVEITWRDVWDYIHGIAPVLPATVLSADGNTTVGNLLIDKAFFETVDENTAFIEEQIETEVLLSE